MATAASTTRTLPPAFDSANDELNLILSHLANPALTAAVSRTWTLSTERSYIPLFENYKASMTLSRLADEAVKRFPASDALTLEEACKQRVQLVFQQVISAAKELNGGKEFILQNQADPISAVRLEEIAKWTQTTADQAIITFFDYLLDAIPPASPLSTQADNIELLNDTIDSEATKAQNIREFLHSSAATSALDVITELDVKWIELPTLPPEIGLLTNLQTLKLAGDDSFLFFPILKNQRNLTTLSITAIPSVPSSFLRDLENCTQLQKLTIDNCRLSEIPENTDHLRNLTNLKTVELSRSESSCFLSTLKNLIHLTDLRVTDIPLDPDSFFTDIGNCAQLETLFVSSCHLQKIPENIDRLSNLKDLNVDRNELSTLPSTIGNLPQLGALSVLYNRFVNPYAFDNLTEKGIMIYGQWLQNVPLQPVVPVRQNYLAAPVPRPLAWRARIDIQQLLDPVYQQPQGFFASLTERFTRACNSIVSALTTALYTVIYPFLMLSRHVASAVKLIEKMAGKAFSYVRQRLPF